MSDSRESIFISAFRSFLKGFFALIGFFFAIFIFIIIIGSIFSGKEAAIPPKKAVVQLLPDLNGNNDILPEKTPAILQIDIHGFIGMGEMKSEIIENILLESRKYTLKNDRVKGILLHMNTGGGAVVDGDNIYRMLLEYKEKYNVPIYAFVDGMNASGGVYIAAAADKIYASPISIIGSVGILSGPYFNFNKTLDAIGIESTTLTNGKDKDSMNPFRPWTEDEAKNRQDLQDYFYTMFIDIVTKARPKLSKEKLISTYGAHVFPAPLAEEYGYIDRGNTSYKETLKALLIAANINVDEKYQVIKLNRKKNLMEELFETSALFKGKINHQIKFSDIEDKINEKISFTYNP